MRSVEEQQARVAAAAVAPRPVRVAIAEAQGLMCAEEVVTERPLPGFDQAAIDGYAVRSVDVLGIGGVGADDGEGGVEDDRRPREISLPVMGLIEEGHPVHVVVHRGSRHDLGNPGGYLKAAVDFALERDDYGPELRRWLTERLGLAPATTEH